MKRHAILMTVFGGILAFGLGYSAVAKLHEPFRDGFHARPGDAGEAFDVQIAQKICGHAVDYKFLDFQYGYNHEQNKPAHLDFVMERYHYRTNCLINDAMNTAIKQVNDVMNDKLGGEDVDNLTDNEDTIEICDDVRLHTIQTTQLQNKSLLEEEGGSTMNEGADANEARYQLEDVSRTMLREMCGYHLFLETLKDDTEGFSYEFKAKNGNVDGLRFEDFEEAAVMRRNMLDQEIDQSRQALVDTLGFYSDFLSSYQLHAALEANMQRMGELNEDFADVEQKIETLTGQFPNATSYICSQ